MLSFREVHFNTYSPPLQTPAGSPGIYYPPVYTPGGTTGGTGGTTPTDPTPTSQVLFFVASCDASAQPGQAVTASGPATVAIADCRSPEAVVGIITRKRSPTQAVVQTAGEVVLGLSGLSPGVDYFLGGNGAIVPPPLTGITFVQRVGMATSATSLYLALDGHVVRQNP